MKKIILLFTLISSMAFGKAEEVIGKWITEKAENGKIYNPTNGKTYNSYMKLQKDGKLLVKGSIDKKGLIGKKQIWTRYE